MDRVLGRRRGVRHGMTVLACAGAALALGGCADDGYGYGYGGVSGGGFYGPGTYEAGGGDGDWPGYGWYDGFYYPGSGLYAYDRIGHRRRWEGPHGHWHGRPPGGGGGGRHPGPPPGGWHRGGPDRPGGAPAPAAAAAAPGRPAPVAGALRPQGRPGGFPGGGRHGGGHRPR